jgi:short chain dehydrogenase
MTNQPDPGPTPHGVDTRDRSVRPVALVAGASRGIGAETALAFAQAGYDVVVGARDGEALQQVVARIEAAAGTAVAAVTDVGDDASMARLVDLATETFGRVDTPTDQKVGGSSPSERAAADQDIRGCLDGVSTRRALSSRAGRGDRRCGEPGWGGRCGRPIAGLHPSTRAHGDGLDSARDGFP